MCGTFLMIKVLLPCYSEFVNEEGSEMRSNSFYPVDKMAIKLLDIGAIFQYTFCLCLIEGEWLSCEITKLYLSTERYFH